MEDRILRFLPFGGSLLIFFGVLKVTIFYGYFGIPILSYLSLADVLILFLNDINSVVTVLIIGLLHVFLSEEAMDSIDSDKLDFLILKYRKFGVIFHGLASIVLLILLSISVINIALWNIYLILFFTINLFTYAFVKESFNQALNRSEPIIRAKKILLTICAVLVGGIIPMIALRDIQQVGNKSDVVILYLNDGGVIKSEEYGIYLGKAGEHHFLTDGKSNSTIIQHADVEMVEIKY